MTHAEGTGCSAHGAGTCDGERHSQIVPIQRGAWGRRAEYGVPAPRVELPLAAAPDFPRLEALAKKYQIELLGALPQ